jgi:hypothetical protein
MDKMKWRTTPFPWLMDILDLLGDNFATGRYSYTGGGARADEDDIIDLDDRLDPSLRSSVSTPQNTQFDDDTPEEDTEDSQSQSRRSKRAHELGPLVPQKKNKTSGLNMIERIGEGMIAIAGAIGQESNTETVRATLQGQAQEKIQEEARLTEEGQFLMIKRFNDVTVARTYLALKSESLQLKFLKEQLEGLEGELFINWEE